jgi:hypothetical protein
MKTPYWHSLLADPTTEVKLCFFGAFLQLGTVPSRAVWDIWRYLLECRSTYSLLPGPLGGWGKRRSYVPDARCDRRSVGGWPG